MEKSFFNWFKETFGEKWALALIFLILSVLAFFGILYLQEVKEVKQKQNHYETKSYVTTNNPASTKEVINIEDNLSNNNVSEEENSTFVAVKYKIRMQQTADKDRAIYRYNKLKENDYTSASYKEAITKSETGETLWDIYIAEGPILSENDLKKRKEIIDKEIQQLHWDEGWLPKNNTEGSYYEGSVIILYDENDNQKIMD